MASQIKFRSLGLKSRPALHPVFESTDSTDVVVGSDWVDITPADLPVKLDDPVWHTQPSLSLNTSLAVVDRTDARSISESLTLTLRPDHPEAPYNNPQHVRSRPSLSIGRWKNLSKVSLQSPTQSLRNRFSKSFRRNSKREDTRSILDDFPPPPSHLPTPVSPSAGQVQPNACPWPAEENSHSRSSSVPTTHNDKSPVHEAKSPSESHPTKSSSTNPFKSLSKVFTTFTSKPHHPQREVPVERPLPPLPPESLQQEVAEPESEPEPVEPSQEAHTETEQLPPKVVVTVTTEVEFATSANPTTYEFVDPSLLCSEPSPSIGAGLFSGSARSSFAPPSPSWLSRNVPQLDTSPDTCGSEGIITPPSPAPLPIPPRIVISGCSTNANTPPLSPLEVTDIWLKHLDTAAQSRYSRISNASNLSRKSSAASINGYHRSDSKNPVLTPVLLFTSPSVEDFSEPSSPAAIPISSSRFSYAESDSDSLQTPGFETPSESSSTFDSPRGNLEAPSHPYISQQPALSSNLINLLSVICAEARITMEEHGGNDLWGKRTDVVDFGGEVDYSGVQWFKEPFPEQPPPSQPQTQQQVAAYDPEPMVVQQNEHFGFALSASPNVLYGRWKQYGQLGVLGWCSEFAELIDNLKDLGIQGNMFLETRRKALEACRDIMKLKMDIKMQIVVMYLSAQVQRLRRFLDPENNYDDYPEPAFPLDPYHPRG
ncbi:hypothetical protein AAF712_000693 [Marasmius tenuissimus]|uniref:Uncharacterized protein n=1 Tax=Marasmius tenuissimus TaxID=585030 RepID=A0ABR3ACZ8_9AGAR